MGILGQMFFTMQNGSRAFGWNEGVYLITAETLPAALVDLQTLVAARAKLLGAGVKVPYLRVSKTDVLNDTQVSSYSNPSSGLLVNAQGVLSLLTFNANDPRIGAALSLYNAALGTGLAAAELTGLVVDQPEVGYLLRMEGGSTYTARRPYLLRGMPDGVVRTSSDGPRATNNALSVNWLNAYDEWVAVMKNGKYGFNALDTSGGNPQKDITNWAVANDTNVVTATIPDLNATKGSKVRVSGVKIEGPTGEAITFGDLLTVESVTSNAYVFSGGSPGNIFVRSTVLKDNVIFANGKARRQQYTPLAFNNIVGRRWGSKDTGAPFDPPHGSAKARR